jgi:hypothetical protein
MKYEIKNLSYQPLRISINGREIIVPGRNDTLENSVIADSINDDIKLLALKGLIKYKIIK